MMPPEQQQQQIYATTNAINAELMKVKEQDLQYRALQQEIAVRQQLLLERQQRAADLSEMNCYLRKSADYLQEYYAEVKRVKEEQIMALKMIQEYVRETVERGELSKHNVEDAKVEQAKILQEIGKIKESVGNLKRRVTQPPIKDNDRERYFSRKLI